MQATTLIRTPGTSLHRQLFTVLRDQIVRGAYQAGAPLPTEEELCTQFGVSRITVRRALTDLEDEGLLERRQGKGTFVSQDVPPARAVATRGLIETMRQISDETRVEVLSFERESPSADATLHLDLTDEEALLHAVRLRFKGDTPVMITEAWVPGDLARGVTRKMLERHALYELLIQRGVRFERVVQEFTAVAASPEHAKLLRTAVGQPLIRINRVIYDASQRPVQYLVVLMTAERSRLLMDFAISSLNTLEAGSIFHDVPA